MTLSQAELDERFILALMTTDTKKLAISVGYPLGPERQEALERLMLKDWIRLIDIAALEFSHGYLMRVFRVMPEAVAWYEANR